MSYQLYRNTTLGHTLQESLDELIQCGQITPDLALKVLLQFDKAINNALSSRVNKRVNFKIANTIAREKQPSHTMDENGLPSPLQAANTIDSFKSGLKSYLFSKAYPSAKLNTYRFCDNVWTFVLTDAEFREGAEPIRVDKVKIVACDGKGAAGHE